MRFCNKQSDSNLNLKLNSLAVAARPRRHTRGQGVNLRCRETDRRSFVQIKLQSLGSGPLKLLTWASEVKIAKPTADNKLGWATCLVKYHLTTFKIECTEVNVHLRSLLIGSLERQGLCSCVGR